MLLKIRFTHCLRYIYYMRIIFIILFFPVILSSQSRGTTDPRVSQEFMVERINELRQEGCSCSGRYMPPVEPIRWEEKLVQSARIHAQKMHEYRFFAHIGPDGKDVGDRMERVGYRWQFAGENLGEGQRHFMQVLKDWIKSPSHCKLLMDSRMEDMGIARKGKYWVQHFGKALPKNMYRKNQRYSEGM